MKTITHHFYFFFIFSFCSLFLFQTASAQDQNYNPTQNNLKENLDAEVEYDPETGNLLDVELDDWHLHSPYFSGTVSKKFKLADEIAINFSHNAGNTRQFSIGGDNELVFSYYKFKNTLQTGLNYSQSVNFPGTALSVVGRHIYIDEKMEWHWHRRLYNFGSFDWHTDKPSGLQNYYSGNGGFGIYAIDTNKVILTFEGGYHFSHEDVISTLTDNTIHSFLIGGSFNWNITDTTSWSHEIETIIQASDARNSRINYTSSLSANLISNLYLSLDFNLRFDSRPITGYKKYDTSTTSSFSLKF